MGSSFRRRTKTGRGISRRTTETYIDPPTVPVSRGAFPVAYQAWRRKIEPRFTKISRIEVYSIFLFVIRKMGGARRQISLIKFVERGRILREEDGIFFFVGFIINPEIFEDHRNWN